MRTEGCTAKMVFSHSTFYQRLSDRVVHSKLFRIFTLKMRLIAGHLCNHRGPFLPIMAIVDRRVPEDTQIYGYFWATMGPA